MRYLSTRDKSISRTFEEALLAGYASDGGLFVPECLPEVSTEDLKAWSSLSYADLAMKVLRNFISTDEVSDDELRVICKKSFHDGFDAPNDCVVPVIKVGSLHVVELFHGPTFCFKDLGMGGVVNLLSHFTTKRKCKTTLLVSTTGDTGPAAVHAVKNADSPYLGILVHYPMNQISTFQRRQMTTVDSRSVKVACFEGGGDDMDSPIKEILTEHQQHHSNKESERKRILCGVNSYNIGRPLMQMVHFFWTYLRVAEQVNGEIGVTKVDVILPTGAMGNITGGFMAKRMGLPLGKLCAGVNINDITHRVVQTGKFYRADDMKMTLSEAINIQLPYNFERLLFYITDENDMLVREWMEMVDSVGKLDLENDWLEKLQAEFSSARITDDEMCSAMADVKDSLDYFTDPHTAVALAAAKKLGYCSCSNGVSPTAILATASPCKFEKSVTTALGLIGWRDYQKRKFPKRAIQLLTLDEAKHSLDAWPSELSKSFVEAKEILPVRYTRLDDLSLAETQEVWKKTATSIVNNM